MGNPVAKEIARHAALHLRSYTEADAPCVVALAEHVKALEPGSPQIDSSRWRYVCNDPYADPEAHFRVAEDEHGEIVGFGYRFDPPRSGGGRYRAVCVIVHPDHRRVGLGRALYEEVALEQQHDASDEGWHVATAVDHRSLSGLPFAKAMGFRKSSERVVLRRELPGRPVPDADCDAKIERFLGPSAFKDWASLNNATLGETEGASPVSADELEDNRPDGFRPEHVRFARLDNRRVGFLFLRETSAGGFIETVGVLPESRKSSIGTGLVASALAYLIERGHTGCEVVCEERNKAALKVFNRMGFEEFARRTYLVKKPRVRRKK